VIGLALEWVAVGSVGVPVRVGLCGSAMGGSGEVRGRQYNPPPVRRTSTFTATACRHRRALDEALERLTRHEPRGAQLVNLHCFAGLTVEQAAEALGLSRTEAYRL
jgi:hypothetical protein